MLIEAGLPPIDGIFRYGGFEPLGDISEAQTAAISGYFAPMTLDEAKSAKKSEIAAARYAAEIAGVTVGGATVRTDRESQSLITGAALKALQDAEYVCSWKTDAGFVELSAPQILAIADAVRAHVQSCFDRERALLALIDAAETPEDLEAVTW
jgi:hypothetical protein